MDQHAGYWIERLGLQPHPEGGYYRETYRAAGRVVAAGLPPHFAGARCYCTAIYFLLARGQRSALHRLASDELWHWHAGGALELTLLHPDGRLEQRRLGPDPERGEAFQLTIPAGCWFGAQPAAAAPYVLLGCTVAPGFEFADFELGVRAELLAHFPQHRAAIEALS